MDKVSRIQEGIVYRVGSRTSINLTPRPGDDTAAPPGEVPGLSTWTTLELAAKPGEKAQKIDLARLKGSPLFGFMDENGHVSIVPVDATGNIDTQQLEAWAACRQRDQWHPFAQLLADAIIEVERRQR